MATRNENSRLEDLEKDVIKMKVQMEQIIIPELRQISKTLKDNMGGIELAQLLNSRIISVVLAGLVAAGIYFVAKTGGIGL